MTGLTEKERQIVWNALRVARDTYLNHALVLRLKDGTGLEAIAIEFDKHAQECTDIMVKFE